MNLKWLLVNQFGINPRQFIRAILRLPKFYLDYLKFRKLNNEPIKFKYVPCLNDYDQENGESKNEYFVQDLFVAQQVYHKSPRVHLDVGSRIDGFVSNVASFREIIAIDLRKSSQFLNNINFRTLDIMSETAVQNFMDEYPNGFDSISCLHTIEHLGLGRYGDPIDPLGYEQGIKNLSSMLSPDGIIYLSTPVGVETVIFNANWIFSPNRLKSAFTKNRLQIQNITIIDTQGFIVETQSSPEKLKDYAQKSYHLCIFELMRSSDKKKCTTR